MTNEIDSQSLTDEETIILIGIERTSYYLFRGEEYIDQLLIVDGEFPKPVKCLHFDTLFDVKLILGETVNVMNFWGIHPNIVGRLRDTGELVEIDG